MFKAKGEKAQRNLRGIIKVFLFQKQGPTLHFKSLKETVHPLQSAIYVFI